MKALTDGERDVLAECEADARGFAGLPRDEDGDVDWESVELPGERAEYEQAVRDMGAAAAGRPRFPAWFLADLERDAPESLTWTEAEIDAAYQQWKDDNIPF